jgi:hypothetical protein
MVNLGLYNNLLQHQAHGRTQVLQGIDRWPGEIAALDARTMADIASLKDFLGIL